MLGYRRAEIAGTALERRIPAHWTTPGCPFPSALHRGNYRRLGAVLSARPVPDAAIPSGGPGQAPKSLLPAGRVACQLQSLRAVARHDCFGWAAMLGGSLRGRVYRPDVDHTTPPWKATGCRFRCPPGSGRAEDFHVVGIGGMVVGQSARRGAVPAVFRVVDLVGAHQPSEIVFEGFECLRAGGMCSALLPTRPDGGADGALRVARSRGLLGPSFDRARGDECGASGYREQKLERARAGSTTLVPRTPSAARAWHGGQEQATDVHINSPSTHHVPPITQDVAHRSRGR
jgi:hypothetical protein